METERNEVYERIPWETLEKKSTDKQWVLMAVAGSAVLGALVFSVVSSRPPQIQPIPPSTVASAVPLPQVLPPVAIAPQPTSPILVADADLYAVDPERWLDRATAHAEWFVAEYFTVDGSPASAEILGRLLPAGMPNWDAPETTSVFVEWVRTLNAAEVAPFRYRVEVLVRSLVADGDNSYLRQAPIVATVEVAVDEKGPRILMPPEVRPATIDSQEIIVLAEVPAEIAAMATSMAGTVEILGGRLLDDGRWQVVVVGDGRDGASRPMTVTVP